MAVKIDIYDRAPWTEMDLRDLTAALRSGDTVDEVQRKAEELGLFKVKPPM